MGIKERIEVDKQSVERNKNLSFGDPVTNVCAGPNNRHWYFVRKKYHNKTIQVTDKKGNFFAPHREVIFPGHLSPVECEALYKPIWEANFK